MNYHHTDSERIARWSGPETGPVAGAGARHAASRPAGRLRLRTALVGAVGTVVAAAAGPAMATPLKPVASPTEDPAATKARIASLYREADELTQQYDAAQERAAALTVAVQRSQAALEQGRADYAREQADLGTIAAAQYRAGYLDKQLEMLLADHPDTFLTSAALADRLSDEQLAKVARVIDGQRELHQLQRAAYDQLAALAQTRTEVAAARQDVAAQLRQAQSLVNTLSAAQRRQVANADLGADPGASPAAPVLTTPDAEIPATGRARTAIAAAYSLLGKPYIYGAEGPDGFDCSGLIQAIWRQAGVALPRTSSEQALAGKVVAPGAIQPGDLVIYYKERNHIGIYIGDGKIIHAPHPGSQVKISPLNSMPVDMVVRV